MKRKIAAIVAAIILTVANLAVQIVAVATKKSAFNIAAFALGLIQAGVSAFATVKYFRARKILKA